MNQKIVDGQLLNQITNKTMIIKAEPIGKMKEILEKLFSPHQKKDKSGITTWSCSVPGTAKECS